MSKSYIIKVLMDGLALCLISASVCYSVLLSSIDSPFSSILTTTILIYLMLTILLWNKWTIILLLPTTIILWGVYLFSNSQDKWEHSVLPFFTWLIPYLSGQNIFMHEYTQPIIWLFSAILTTIFFILIVKLRFFTVPFILSTALLLILWFMTNKAILPYVWYYTLGVIILWSGKNHRTLTRDYSMPDYGLWQLCTLPLALTIILSTFLLIPKDTSHLKWTFLENKVRQIDETFNSRYGFTGSRKVFRLSQTGFPSSQNQLGGPVRLNNDIALLVSSSLPLYLRGTILNEYMSTGWRDTVDDMRYRFADISWQQVRLETYDFTEPIWEHLNEYEKAFFFPKIEATITHQGINSSVLFNVQRLYNIKSRGAYTPYFNAKGETFTSRSIEKSESYTLTAYIPNLSHIEFRNYLTDKIPVIDWRQLQLTEDIYGEKLLAIQKNYTELPVTIPDRIYDLVENLTGDLDTNLEKVLAIQTFLTNNYQYTLIPPHTPKNMDFVDYFLFELKEGYCTYFATAMAVMTRAAGLPSRYIEGFLMPSTPNDNGIYEVRNKNGHAWVEVYFPWVGWIPFDPTPSGSINEEPGAGGYTGYDNPYWEEYWKDYLRDREFIDGQPPIGKPGTGNKIISITNPISITIMMQLFIIMLSVLLLSTLIIYGLYKIYWIRITHLSLDKQFHIYYDEILWLLKLYGSPIIPGETPYTYGEKIDRWLLNPEADMMDISNLLVKSEFGGYTLKHEDITKIRLFYNHLLHSTGKSIGIIKFMPGFIFHVALQQKALIKGFTA